MDSAPTRDAAAGVDQAGSLKSVERGQAQDKEDSTAPAAHLIATRSARNRLERKGNEYHRQRSDVTARASNDEGTRQPWNYDSDFLFNPAKKWKSLDFPDIMGVGSTDIDHKNIIETADEKRLCHVMSCHELT
ncbi:unnamed protein product [Pieris brassicae]|uniref:Uncharacterized protein n=1 Tax=Pieris brassicae TaxID=7116 RepID=A0A9P0TNE1_PIEBR|nr:unnamed protein product [Pieris brassicae]